MSQSHGTSLWQEPANGGATPSVMPVYVIDSSGDAEVASTRPERYAFYVVGPGTTAVLLDLTPTYIVFVSGDPTVDLVGPAAAVWTFDIDGNLTISTDFTDPIVADGRFDPAGGLWIVLRTIPRLDGLRVGGSVLFY